MHAPSLACAVLLMWRLSPRTGPHAHHTRARCADVALAPLGRTQGPTLTMRVHEYSLMRDVLATLARPRQPASMWKAPPLVVMNNFGGHEELALATALFQNLFPRSHVQTARLSCCQV